MKAKQVLQRMFMASSVLAIAGLVSILWHLDNLSAFLFPLGLAGVVIIPPLIFFEHSLKEVDKNHESLTDGE